MPLDEATLIAIPTELADGVLEILRHAIALKFLDDPSAFGYGQLRADDGHHAACT
jgi:hypothetical protein